MFAHLFHVVLSSFGLLGLGAVVSQQARTGLIPKAVRVWCEAHKDRKILRCRRIG